MDLTKQQRRHMIKKTIELFVPAYAMEHHSNPETATRRDKASLAILRHYLTNDFNEAISPMEEVPTVILGQMTFNPKKFGYDVLARIKG